MNEQTYTFEKVTFNNQAGYIATRRAAGVFAGRAFGKTKKDAIAAFDIETVREYISENF